MPMNKKLILTAWILAVALTTASVTNFTYASDDWIDDDDSSETQDMNDDNEDEDDDINDDDINDDDMDDDNDDDMDDKKEMKNEMKKEMKSTKEDRKANRGEMHEEIFNQLDSKTKEAIALLRKSYVPQFDAIKADTTKTLEEKKAALKALHAELREKIKALLPTDLQDDFDTMKSEIEKSRDAYLSKKEEIKTELNQNNNQNENNNC